ncbi:hypothetical protein ACFQ07_26815 [Actinomadura adrarensis]|uniref:Uncharacterized protein n=1 Tax=Actinomadura adrarensis TaxID=1819600 RepID=A0ABW3CMX5_9ACTN
MNIESPRAVFHALRSYTGSSAYAEVLSPWLDGNADRLREQLAPLSVHGGWRREVYVFGDLLEQAYALSRLNDVLLLGFQPSLPAGADQPWAHELHLDRPWPAVTVDQYLETFAGLGATPIGARGFDPFFHEIVAVEQAADPDAPIEIIDTLWPGLMLGEMLLSRAGVRVRAGIRHAEAGVADESLLSEVFLRRYRDTQDQSLGWGHNSQWKTDFRRDYLTGEAYHFNVDADHDVDSAPIEPTDQRALLTAEERRDLLRHRCFVRTPENTAARDGWCFDWRLSIPRTDRQGTDRSSV